jgi:hypothetical protein
MANLIPIDKSSGLKRMTTSYARYLMSVHQKRILNKDEHVDHKDDNKMHDDIDNLQILTLQQNNIKEAKRKGRKMVLLRCPHCGKEFIKEHQNTHLSKGGSFTGCSRKCSTTFGTKLYYHPDDIDLLEALRLNVVKEYRKHT